MKKWTKGLIATLFTGAIIFTGCSSIAQVKNDKTEILYNGGSVVAVGDYLYYGNGYASGVNDYDVKSDSEYNTAKDYSYLSRTKLTDRVDSQYKNENEVNKLNDRIAGYSNSYMFALGNYIYFASPNLHKTSGNEYVWEYVSLFRIGLNGGNAEEIYTTKAYNSSSANIKALSYNNNHYLIVFDGTNLVQINIGNKISVKEIGTATSVALPDENESWNGNIYYTTENNSTYGHDGNIAYSYNVETESSKKICQEINLTVTFTGRVGNKVFFSRSVKGNSNVETYIYDADNANGLEFNSASKRFYNLAISDIDAVAENNTTYYGYTFTVTTESKTQVMYYNELNKSTSVFISADTGYANTVASWGTYYYYMTSDSIVRKTLDTKEETTIVSDMTIKNDGFAYDYYYTDGNISGLKNIYFYAQVPAEETEDDEETTSSDTNYYLYKVDYNGARKPALVGKNK